jgi:hypothetical protein
VEPEQASKVRCSPSAPPSGRKVLIAPDSGDAWAPTKPRPDETLIRALARAHRWKRMLDEGRYRSAGELAEAEGVTRSFINRVLRLTLLAPDIVEAILDGRQPKAMELEEVTRAMPSGWEEQQDRSTFERFAKSKPDHSPLIEIWDA